jgi:FkbM family methyltransferase
MNQRPNEPELVLEFFGNKSCGFFVDVGANDPQNMSQTWLLESKGWRGLLVEPLPHLAEKLRAARPGSQVIQAACGPHGHPATVEIHEAECSMHSGLNRHAIDARERYVAVHKVPMLALDEILAGQGNPKPDFVSIDVEGMELEVLRGFDLVRHAPTLLLIEDHLFDWQVHGYLSRSGYRLVKRTGLNNWYVRVKQPFAMTTSVERLKLWRKVWVGTPWRGFKHRLQLRFRRGAAASRKTVGRCPE